MDDGDSIVYYEPCPSSFKVEKYLLGVRDEYWACGKPPRPYENESPYFFILQVAARTLIRKGYIFMTDTVSFTDRNGRSHLVLGYPHDGKSSLLAIAYSRGDAIHSTENTVLKIDGRLKICCGTRILVYNPAVYDLYDIRGIKPLQTTRHGYHIVEVGDKEPTSVDDITLIHASYRSRGVDYEKISGRKIMKTLWHFTTAVVNGTDYYNPHPLPLATNDILDKVHDMIAEAARLYHDKGLMEVFGSHLGIYRLLTEKI